MAATVVSTLARRYPRCSIRAARKYRRAHRGKRTGEGRDVDDRQQIHRHPDIGNLKGRGGGQEITLPKGVTVESVEIGETPAPIVQNGRTLSVYLVPGEHTVAAKWRAPVTDEGYLITLKVHLGTRAANATVSIERVRPWRRWVLWTVGPDGVDHISFWIKLIFWSGVALFLGRARGMVLKTGDWLLPAIAFASHASVTPAIVIALVLVGSFYGRRLTTKKENREARFVLVALYVIGVIGILTGGVLYTLFSVPGAELDVLSGVQMARCRP